MSALLHLDLPSFTNGGGFLLGVFLVLVVTTIRLAPERWWRS